MPRLDVILPLGPLADPDGRAVKAALAALPSDGRLVILAGPGAEPAVDDPRLEVHRTDETLSVHRAMNWLLEHTDSDLVASAEPGDASLPWRFRRAVRALAGSADVVFAPVMGAGTSPRAFAFSDGPALGLGEDAMRLHLLLSSRVPSGTLVGRRTALAGVGGYRDVAMADYDLALRIAAGPARMQRLSAPGVITGARPAPAVRRERRRETEGLVADAFRALSSQLLGRAYLRLPVLAALPLSDEELDEELAAFQNDMRDAADRLPLHERVPLLRALRRRVEATRALHRSEMASVAW